jgi:hypothetical protein
MVVVEHLDFGMFGRGFAGARLAVSDFADVR